ncbi:MAG: EI24 domain-containing protein [Epsilonproteobacteria bacterium]|nr:EI24 domain-containing protein [Campylobacterota bacterium]
MKRVINSIIVAFSEILSWHTIKFALSIGFISILIWIGVGYYIWDYIALLSSKIIQYIPFSMIKSNGAWMLSTFLWFQLVLITFALLYVFLGNIILNRVSKEKYSSLTLITAFASAAFWGIMWYFIGDKIYNEFLNLLNMLPFKTIEKAIAFLVGLYIIYNAIIVTILFIVSIFSPLIIKKVQRDYFNEESDIKTIFSSIRYTIKDTIIFIILSILAFPLLFIPILNIFVQLILWIWLFKDTLSYDALLLVYKEPKKEILKENRFAIYFITMIAVMFNFIPIFNIFGPIFGEIAMFHYFKSLKNS